MSSETVARNLRMVTVAMHSIVREVLELKERRAKAAEMDVALEEF